MICTELLMSLQVMQCIRVDLGVARIEKKQDILLDAFVVGPGRLTGQSLFGGQIEWLSVAVTQELPSKNPIFFLS